MLEFPVIQGRASATSSRTAGSPASQFRLRNPNYRGGPASLLDGVEVVVDGERIPDHVPLWTLQGRTFTLDELRASTDVRWQLDEPATITVPKPGGLSARACTRLEVTIFLRRSYIPPLIARTPFPRGGQGRDRAAGAGGPHQVRRLDLQLHRRRQHLDDARGRASPRSPTSAPPASRSSARATSRTTRRPIPAWIDSWHGLRAEVRPDADQLRLVGRHHPLARPRPDRRGGRRAAAARPAPRQAARLHLGAAEVRRHLLGPRPAPDLAGDRRAVAGPRRRARRRHLPGDPRADADQAPGDPGLHRLHREDRHRALQAAHRHRHLQHRADPRALRGDRRSTARRSRRTCGR